MSQEMEDSDVMATEEQWQGDARPLPPESAYPVASGAAVAAAAARAGGWGGPPHEPARARDSVKGDNKEWVPALRLVVEDASGRLSVLLCGQNAVRPQ